MAKQKKPVHRVQMTENKNNERVNRPPETAVIK